MCVCAQLVHELMKPDPGWGPARREHREQFITHVQKNIGRSMDELFQSDAHLLRRLHRVVTNTSIAGRSNASVASAPQLQLPAISIVAPTTSLAASAPAPLLHSHTAPGDLKAALAIAQQLSRESSVDDGPAGVGLNITVLSSLPSTSETEPEVAAESVVKSAHAATQEAKPEERQHSEELAELEATCTNGDKILHPHEQVAAPEPEARSAAAGGEQKHDPQVAVFPEESKAPVCERTAPSYPSREQVIQLLQCDPDVADLGASDIVPLRDALQFTH